MTSSINIFAGDERVGGGREGIEEPSTCRQEGCHPGETRTYWTKPPSVFLGVCFHLYVAICAAFPGEGGGVGAGGGKRAAAAGGDPHGPGGGSA